MSLFHLNVSDDRDAMTVTDLSTTCYPVAGPDRQLRALLHFRLQE